MAAATDGLTRTRPGTGKVLPAPFILGINPDSARSSRPSSSWRHRFSPPLLSQARSMTARAASVQPTKRSGSMGAFLAPGEPAVWQPLDDDHCGGTAAPGDRQGAGAGGEEGP